MAVQWNKATLRLRLILVTVHYNSKVSAAPHHYFFRCMELQMSANRSDANYCIIIGNLPSSCGAGDQHVSNSNIYIPCFKRLGNKCCIGELIIVTNTIHITDHIRSRHPVQTHQNLRRFYVQLNLLHDTRYSHYLLIRDKRVWQRINITRRLGHVECEYSGISPWYPICTASSPPPSDLLTVASVN